MKDAMILLFHLLAVIARLLQPGGGRTIVAVCLNCLWQLELAIRHGQVDKWVADLEALGSEDSFFWSLCQFFFKGRKP
jgi:hypothetical protein